MLRRGWQVADKFANIPRTALARGRYHRKVAVIKTRFGDTVRASDDVRR